MGKKSYDAYGVLAERGLSYTEISGRYRSQENLVGNIVPDVIQKLKISSEDDLLEIGCGPGNLLIPLSFLTASATGIDNAQSIAVARKRFPDPALQLLAGNFLELSLKKTYSKILIYSVLVCLSPKEVFPFLDKALDLLRPGGLMLLGDFPNADKKARFLSTSHGRAFHEAWKKNTSKNEVKALDVLGEDPDRVQFDDESILKIIRYFRKKSCEAYLLPQPLNLPFSNSREDIIVFRPQN